MSDCFQQEEWRLVPGFEKYAVSSYGVVKRITQGRGTKHGRLLKPSYNTEGRPRISLYYEPNKMKTRSVAQVVAMAFLGKRPPGKEINHKNGVRDHNRLENLEYVTPEENHYHAQIHGLLSHGKLHGDTVRGERNGYSKLSTGEVIEIKKKGRLGVLSHSQIAKEYPVNRSVISRILEGKLWSHVEVE